MFPGGVPLVMLGNRVLGMLGGGKGQGNLVWNQDQDFIWV